MRIVSAMDSLTLITVYLITINLIGFAIMGIDKHKARINTFRIPEATLFYIAIIGGSIGSIIGMHLFRHKTRHWYFVWGMPLILILQLVFIFVISYYADFRFI